MVFSVAIELDACCCSNVAAGVVVPDVFCVVIVVHFAKPRILAPTLASEHFPLNSHFSTVHTAPQTQHTSFTRYPRCSCTPDTTFHLPRSLSHQ